MFKNAKVSQKIGLGFGAIILLVLVLTGVTTVTSLTRNSDLQRIDQLTHIQTEANGLLNNMQSARAASATAFTDFDPAEAYNTMYAHIDAAADNMTGIETYWAEISGQHDELNAQLRASIVALRENVEGVQANDAALGTQLEVMIAASQSLEESCNNMLDQVTNLTIANATEDMQSTVNRLQTIIKPAQALKDEVDDLRVASADLIVGLDTGVTADLKTALENISANAASLKNALTTAEAKGYVDGMQANIVAYTAALDAFTGVVANSDTLIAAATEGMNTLIEMVGSGVENDTATILDNLDAAISASYGSLILSAVVAALSIVLSAIIAFTLGKAITRPLGKMQGILVQAGGTGNLNFSEEVRADVLKEAEARDELGQSLGAFARFVDRIVYISQNLEAVAEGDLSADIELLSEEDTLGNSLAKMSDNLNRMFREINDVSRQVATSSGEIAIGSQNLAQGATEQASTIQEISASISEITSQADTSVTTAKGAAADGAHIRDIAADGNAKMKQMMAAVREINEASQSISQVIKVIDDIAFQTGILALNAAVEAARAGEHGKGFAVVADEVRNLSGKSADAAKETAGLISASVEKAATGLAIAQETAGALDEIVQGIQRTSDSLETVAQQSEGSRAATIQVNEAVNQVAQVVQQNSATSEQSAAASEEMSSQAQVLQQLIARFKLKGDADSKAPRAEAQLFAAGGENAGPPPREDIIF